MKPYLSRYTILVSFQGEAGLGKGYLLDVLADFIASKGIECLKANENERAKGDYWLTIDTESQNLTRLERTSK